MATVSRTPAFAVTEPTPRVRASSLQPALVNPVNFLLATRDSGYKTTALALAELIDNSLQAGATDVSVEVLTGDDPHFPIELRVTDNGSGMDASTLAAALTFGGSTRFGDRSSLGRYGMGLPNGPLSRARRVEVYSWRAEEVLLSRLDVDELVADLRHLLPPVTQIAPPAFLPNTQSGTAVRLQRCDRLEYRRISTLTQKLMEELGRIYRCFLVDGVEIRVNDEPVDVVDPLFLHPAGRIHGARQFGDTLDYRLKAEDQYGHVRVRFSELPIERWHAMSAHDKRQLGVTNGPCVSVLRAGREIDRGWFFMGAKRRENYDDWWRCEVRFDPSLDQLFGITHSKQGISPTRELVDTLAPDFEPIARALNSRVRHRFELVKASTPLAEAEMQAARADASLPALPQRSEAVSAQLREILDGQWPATPGPGCPYQLVVSGLATTAAFETVVRRGTLAVVLNSRHPLYRDLYGPLAASESQKDQEMAKRVALAVLAVARAETLRSDRRRRGEARRFRQTWADVLATFFNAQ